MPLAGAMRLQRLSYPDFLSELAEMKDEPRTLGLQSRARHRPTDTGALLAVTAHAATGAPARACRDYGWLKPT